MSGVSGLFTDEFYRRVGSKLSPTGVLGQWLNLYSIDDDLALSVMAAIHHNFRHYETFLVSSGDLLIVATNRPEGLTPDWSVAGRSGMAAVLGHTHPFTPRTFEALRVADQEALAPLLARVRPNSDFHPTLDVGSERTRFGSSAARGWLRLHEDRFGIAALGAPTVDPPPNGPTPLPGATRVRSLMWNARLRALTLGFRSADIDSGGLLPGMPEALDRQRAIGLSCASPVLPPTGKPGCSTRSAERTTATRELRGGSTRATSCRCFRYALKQQAPETVLQILGWMQALDRRDYARASGLSDSLITVTIGPSPWFGTGFFFDGAIMAKLGTGDVEGARRVFARLSPHVRRSPRDLRMRLIAARLGVENSPP